MIDKLRRGQLEAIAARLPATLDVELADLHLYVCPGAAAELDVMLELLPGAHVYTSTAVPPGELRAAAQQLDDPDAREVTP